MRRGIAWMCWVWLMVMGAVAQEAPKKEETGAQQPKTATIEGKVLRATDGTPLKKAVVMAASMEAAPQKNKSATTDADGKFLLKDVEPGRYSLMAMRTGYAQQAYGERRPRGGGTTLTLIAGQQLKDIVFRLVPGGVIAGRVVDEDDEPVYQASVTAQRWIYTKGIRELAPAGGYASTNDLGEYRLSQLAPGRYYVSVLANRMGMMMSGGDTADKVSYAETYFPGVYDASRAAALEVKGGDEIDNINFRITPGHGVRVSGVVKGFEKESMDVRLSPKSGWHFGLEKMAMANAKGEFAFGGVLPGAYVLQAQTWEREKRTSATQIIEVGDSNLEDIQLTLAERPDIFGRVKIEGRLADDTGRIHVILVPEDGPQYGAGEPGTLDEKLNFKLKGYDEGDYRVSLWGLPEDAYVKLVMSGTQEALLEPLHITGQVKPLEIVVSANGAHVEGTVTDGEGKPFTAARIVLVPDEEHRERREFYGIGSTDQYGKFSLKGVRPGAYTLFAWDKIEEGAYMDPEFLKIYAEKGKSVKVSEGDRITEDLKLIEVGAE